MSGICVLLCLIWTLNSSLQNSEYFNLLALGPHLVRPQSLSWSDEKKHKADRRVRTKQINKKQWAQQHEIDPASLILLVRRLQIGKEVLWDAGLLTISIKSQISKWNGKSLSAVLAERSIRGEAQMLTAANPARGYSCSQVEQWIFPRWRKGTNCYWTYWSAWHYHCRTCSYYPGCFLCRRMLMSMKSLCEKWWSHLKRVLWMLAQLVKHLSPRLTFSSV